MRLTPATRIIHSKSTPPPNHKTPGGVLVLSGCVISTNLGVAAQSGTAIMISLGGGTLTVSGVAQDLVVGCEYYSGAGVLSWVGAGSAVLVGLSQGRSIGVGAVYGIGGTMAVGAGDLIVVGNANVDNLVSASRVKRGGTPTDVRQEAIGRHRGADPPFAPSSTTHPQIQGCASVVLIGGNYFLGAGVFVEIGSPMAKNAGVLFGIFLVRWRGPVRGNLIIHHPSLSGPLFHLTPTPPPPTTTKQTNRASTPSSARARPWWPARPPRSTPASRT